MKYCKRHLLGVARRLNGKMASSLIPKKYTELVRLQPFEFISFSWPHAVPWGTAAPDSKLLNTAAVCMNSKWYKKLHVQRHTCAPTLTGCWSAAPRPAPAGIIRNRLASRAYTCTDDKHHLTQPSLPPQPASASTSPIYYPTCTPCKQYTMYNRLEE